MTRFRVVVRVRRSWRSERVLAPREIASADRAEKNTWLTQTVLTRTTTLLRDSWQCSTVSPDSMPIGIRWFAQYQPFTPVIDTLRGLLLGTPMGNSAILAVAWCVVLALVGYLWARAVYNRNSPR